MHAKRSKGPEFSFTLGAADYGPQQANHAHVPLSPRSIKVKGKGMTLI